MKGHKILHIIASEASKVISYSNLEIFFVVGRVVLDIVSEVVVSHGPDMAEVLLW